MRGVELLKTTVRGLSARAHRFTTAYRQPVWVVGDGRSGSTWLGQCLNADHRWRTLFEPFHPDFVPAMAGYSHIEFRAPGSDDPAFAALVRRVLFGRLQHPRTERYNRRVRYHGLLVKDIFANLFVQWARELCPTVRPVMIVRNPFAVAVSKTRLQRARWPRQVTELLSQPDLVSAHLQDHTRLLQELPHDPLLQFVAIWAVLHHVPRQIAATDPAHRFRVVFFEHLQRTPSTGLLPLVRELRPDLSTEAAASAVADQVGSPSRTSFDHGTVASHRDPVTDWRAHVSPAQIKAGRRVLDAFGLDELYGEGDEPRSPSFWDS